MHFATPVQPTINMKQRQQLLAWSLVCSADHPSDYCQMPHAGGENSSNSLDNHKPGATGPLYRACRGGMAHCKLSALCSQSALAEEGERLAHCVATYETYCLLGNSHLVSIRDSRGNSLSTAEFTLTEDATGRIRPLCVNHAGPENEPASETCQHTLGALERNWEHPRFQSRFAELFARQKAQSGYLLRSLDTRSSASAATQR